MSTTMVFSQTGNTQHGNRGGCFPTTWPVDMANTNRTNTVTRCGFPENFDTSQIAYSSLLLPFPVFSYSRDTGEVFVMGGCPLILYNYGGAIENGQPTAPANSYSAQFSPYIAKINPRTLILENINLTGGSAAAYIGGAIIHSNGFIYAIAAGRLFKIRSTPFQIVSSVDLPPSGFAQLTFFNGLSVSKTGRIIAKSYNQITGQGSFFLLNQDNLSIVCQTSAAMASPRLTVDLHNNREFIYHLNREETYRLEVVNDTLIKDTGWMAAYDPYYDGSADEPTSPVISGNHVFYTTNTLYSATRAMKLFWQDKNQQYSRDLDTLGGTFLHSDTTNPGWSFFHLTVDDTLSGIIIGNDQGAGKISAGVLDSNNTYHLLWEKSIQTSARPAIVADRNLVYVSDYADGFDHLVVLHLQTGEELGRKKTLATKPTIGTIIITPDDYVIYASNEYGETNGYVHIFSAEDKTSNTPESAIEKPLCSVYPNPAKDAFYLNGITGKYDMQLIDTKGKVVLCYSGVEGVKKIDCGHLSAGLYFLITISQDKTQTQNRIVVK